MFTAASAPEAPTTSPTEAPPPTVAPPRKEDLVSSEIPWPRLLDLAHPSNFEANLLPILAPTPAPTAPPTTATAASVAVVVFPSIAFEVTTPTPFAAPPTAAVVPIAFVADIVHF